jgi:hypothetical protein
LEYSTSLNAPSRFDLALLLWRSVHPSLHAKLPTCTKTVAIARGPAGRILPILHGGQPQLRFKALSPCI